MPFSRQKIGRIAAYTAAFTIPVAITYLVAALRLPPFVFEHLIVCWWSVSRSPGEGGRITAVPVQSGGTVFEVRLPLGPTNRLAAGTNEHTWCDAPATNG